jgi:hypothetical protein
MTATKKIPAQGQAVRAAWSRPEIRRMAAGHAETAFTTATDGATQS